jgi:glutathione S-transferase
MLIIYGHPMSAPTNKVRMCANAAGLDYELVVIDLSTGEHKGEDYLAINPAGQVPAIDHDGFRLFESNAISKYLAKNKLGLYPTEPKAQAMVDQWCDFVSNLVMPGVGRILFNRLLAPQIGVPVNEEAINEGEQMLARALPIVESQLNAHASLAGDDLTIADIALLATVDPAEAIALDLAPFPKLSAWRQQLRGQDFYTRVHKYYGEGATV